MRDFSSLKKYEVGQERIWVCSKCGKEDVWTKGWNYFGKIECTKCWNAVVNKVFCPECSLKEKKNYDC